MCPTSCPAMYWRFPEVSFHYTSQGKNIYHSPGNGSLKDAIYCVYGGDLLENIVHVAHEVGDIRVDGFVSRPGLTMKNRQKGSVFVNRRFVRNSALHDMVKSAYGPMLVKGESPFFALNIFLPASAVDVNVHPNKLQVRFRDATAVEYAIKEAVSQAGRQIHGEGEAGTRRSTRCVRCAQSSGGDAGARRGDADVAVLRIRAHRNERDASGRAG